MKTLDALLARAKKHDDHEKLTRWSNARVALAIRGKYQEHGIERLAEKIGRDKFTLYKWANGAEMYRILAHQVKHYPRAERRRMYDDLSNAARVLGLWYFIVLAEYWRYIEEAHEAIEQLRTATQNRKPVRNFRRDLETVYKPDPLMDYEIQARKAERQMEKVIKAPFVPYLTEIKYKLARWFTNGATTVHCPDCQHEIELERFALSQEMD